MAFSRFDWALIVAAGLQAVALFVGLLKGILQMSEVSSAIAYSLVAGIFTCLSVLAARRLIPKEKPTPDIPDISTASKSSAESPETSTPILGVKLDPGLEHVQLYVFWSPLKRANTRIIKYQNDFPRNKYLVNLKTNKAYRVGAYVWSLLVPYRQIEISSETKWLPFFYQRLWCWLRGFTPIPRAPTRADLLEGTTNFEAGIIENKNSYRKGDTIKFWAEFTGELKNGGFTARVQAPDGVLLPNGKSYDWWADENAKKALNGHRSHSRAWEHQIPENYPTGRFQVGIQVYDNSSEQQTVLDTIDASFEVESEQPVSQQMENLSEIVEREYKMATVKLVVRSSTDWIEIGFIDSTHVTIKGHNMQEGTIRSVEEPHSSHIRIDRPDAKFSVTATFEVYVGPLLIFTRKGNRGTLRVDVLNKNDELIFTVPEYGTNDRKYNYRDVSFDFNDWD